MARYILIDNSSGYVFGDTAVYAGGQSDLTPIAAARLLDESIGVYGREYVEHSINPHTTATGYHVYRADISGSEVVAVVQDGQDAETIEAVQRDCQYLGFVECHTGIDE